MSALVSAIVLVCGLQCPLDTAPGGSPAAEVRSEMSVIPDGAAIEAVQWRYRYTAPRVYVPRVYVPAPRVYVPRVYTPAVRVSRPTVRYSAPRVYSSRPTVRYSTPRVSRPTYRISRPRFR